MEDSLDRLIASCGKYFAGITRSAGFFTASGLFKLGKLDRNGLYKGNSQEVRWFEGKTPLDATQKLYYELKKHYEKEFSPNEKE